MSFIFRKFDIHDKQEILSMMKIFYESDAVSTNGSTEIFNTDIDKCINNSPYLEGYVFCEDKNILGYSMLAKSFSTEFGKPCIWFEDLYLKEQYRGNGIIPEFVKYIKTKYPDSIFKLEVESYNKHAVHVYKKLGFEVLDYIEMINK